MSKRGDSEAGEAAKSKAGGTSGFRMAGSLSKLSNMNKGRRYAFCETGARKSSKRTPSQIWSVSSSGTAIPRLWPLDTRSNPSQHADPTELGVC